MVLDVGISVAIRVVITRMAENRLSMSSPSHKRDAPEAWPWLQHPCPSLVRKKAVRAGLLARHDTRILTRWSCLNSCQGGLPRSGGTHGVRRAPGSAACR